MTQYIPSTKAVSTPLTLMMTRSGMRICLFSLTPPFFQILSLACWDFFLHPQVSFGKNPGAWERRSQAKSSFADNFFIFAAKLHQIAPKSFFPDNFSILGSRGQKLHSHGQILHFWSIDSWLLLGFFHTCKKPTWKNSSHKFCFGF